MDRFRARVVKCFLHPNWYNVKYTNDYGLRWKFIVYTNDEIAFFSKDKAYEMKNILKSIDSVKKLKSNINF